MTKADLPEPSEFEKPDVDAARIDLQNSGSMTGGQMGAAGNNNVQNQGNNNSFGDTYQLIFSSQPPSNVVPRRAEEQVLLQAVRAEVADRLNTSLHQAVFINLTKDGQRDRVLRPWDREIKFNHGEQPNIPPETGIAEVFRQTEIGKKLLILGKPGAGKTTTLLDLAQGLIEIAEQNKDEPIPVLFNLSAWKNTMSLSLRERNSNGTAE